MYHTITSLARSLARYIPICDVWLDKAQHLSGGSVEADEDTIVNLTETQELEDLAGLWCYSVNTV
jgi:hypothetical protein